MILSTLQTAGLLVGISYYIMTLRNQQKSQKHAEETRKIQLMLEITQYIQSGNQADWQDLLNLEWTDFNDFQSKYGFENNPTIYSKRLGAWRNLSVSGLLIRDARARTEFQLPILPDPRTSLNQMCHLENL